MKFSKEIMPLKVTTMHYFLKYRSLSHSKVDVQVDVKLAAVNVGP
jgi:hypothetical protein